MDTLVKLCQVFINDKVLVIVSVTTLAILFIIRIPEKAETIVTAAFTGLFGIAVGMGIRRIGDIGNGTKPPEIKP
ncbi:MAG: hypothetical protein LUQ65_10290 [Candidatus Helarchaeota archaeon]|nr:hypothetical protein [Candidatus Helarchaeota archaeon]